MKSNTINKKEIDKFSKIAEEWWDQQENLNPYTNLINKNFIY